MPRHPFHIVDPRPWPILVSLNFFSVVTGLVGCFHGKRMFLLMFGLLSLSVSIILWWRDVVREGAYLGHRTSYVSRGLRAGLLLFILSDALFCRVFIFIMEIIVSTVPVASPIKFVSLHNFRVGGRTGCQGNRVSFRGDVSDPVHGLACTYPACPPAPAPAGVVIKPYAGDPILKVDDFPPIYCGCGREIIEVW